MTEKAILFDAPLCTACRSCQVACKRWNGRKAEETKGWGTYENPPSLSDRTWLKVGYTDAVINDRVHWLYSLHMCMHCNEASCMNVCPVGAIIRTDEGFVHIDQETCTGCSLCVPACPFGVPHMDEETGKAVKCDGCTSVGLNRLTTEDPTKPDWIDKPACVMGCPTGALKYGDHDTLLSEGKTRVSELKAEGYANACLYGETEVGGMHVLSILQDSPSVYGLIESPQVVTAGMAGSLLTNIATPIAVVPVAIIAFGLRTLYERKERLEAERKSKVTAGSIK